MIYFDNAATTYIKPESVINAVVNNLKNGGNSGRGGHLAALEANRIIYNARKTVSDFFGFESPESIVFTSSATESLNIALQGVLKNNDHVITTCMEHNSVLRPLFLMEERGVEVSFVTCNECGELEYQQMEKLVKSNTRMIVATHGSNVTGNLNDIILLSQFAKEKGLIFLLDASQTAGEFKIDVDKMNIDILCTTGHKGLMGPQGVGLLGVKKEIYIRPFKVGGTGILSFSKEQPDTMPTRLEAGTLNMPGIAGLTAAIEFINAIGLEKISERQKTLMDTFYKGVRDLGGVKIYGGFECHNRAPIVSLNIGDINSSQIADILSTDYNIATRAGAHCAPLLHKHFKTEKQGMVRFSFGYFNTLLEVEEAIKAVKEIAESAI